MRLKLREDREDEPNALKYSSGELPRTSQSLGASTSQGESSAPTGGACGDSVAVDEEFEVTEDVLSYGEIEKHGEEIETDSGL